MTLENVKVSATLWVSFQSSRACYPVLDTGAGPNLIRKDTLYVKWLHQVRVTRGATIKDASGCRIPTTAAVTLTVEAGDLTTEVYFLTCETLSVPCVLGCSFISVHVAAIRPGQSIVEFREADETPRGQTAIIRNLTLSGSHVNVAEVYTDSKPKALRLAKRTRFDAMSETVVWVKCDLAGVCRVRSTLRAYKHQGLTVANGLTDTPVGCPTPVEVANYRRREVIFPKGIRIGIAEPFEGDIL